MKKSLAHTVWECKYHVVWVPKKRRKVVYGILRQEIGTLLRKLCEYKGVELLEGKACIDHVHMCVNTAKVLGINDSGIPERQECDNHLFEGEHSQFFVKSP